MLRSMLLGSVSLALLAPAAAHAQAADTGVGVEEVVVTAQKRAENVQDVPISVTAFSGKALEAAGVQDVRDLRRITPNLSLSTSGQVTNTRVQIRGIGTAGNTAIEPSVGFFLDGIYVPRIGALLSGLNDISSVEVLRGPQGTLFGRNASVGALLLRTTDPGPDFTAEVFGSIGNYGRNRASAIVNMPINETLSTRVSLLAFEGDGFTRNDLTGKRVGRNKGFSSRVSVKWEIVPELTWTLKGDYQHLTGDGQIAPTVIEKTVTPTAAANFRTRLDPDQAGPLTGQTPYLTGTYRRRVFQNEEGDLQDYQTGVSSDLTWDLPSGFTVKLLSGYRDWHDRQYQDSGIYVPQPFQTRQSTFDSQSHSQELQLLSPKDLLAGKANFVAGLYYYEEDYDINQAGDLFPAFCSVFLRNTSTAARVALCQANPLKDASKSFFSQTTKSYAAYAQGTYNITEQLSVTAGLRYSKDDKDGIFRAVTLNPAAAQAPEVTPLTHNKDKITYRFNVSYRPNDDVMLFASYATGFKSGGFDASPGTTGPVGAVNRTFNPETTKNYEVGIKSEFFDRRLQANATVYRTDIAEFQFRSYDGLQFRVRNNGEVRQQGVEFDLVGRPLPPLTLTFSAAYLDSKYTDFRGAPPLPAFTAIQDLTGERLPFSPKWQGAASAQYVGDLPNGMTWLARGDMAFTSSQNLSASGDNNPDAVQGGYAQFGARLAIRGPEQRWELALTGQNLTKEDYCVVIFNQPNNAAFGLNNPATGGTVLRCALNEPRTIAVEARARF
ncbi:MAG: TonB-dependent receptor [Phenylobacterium sp.]|uniref:TonB-dependent receptor n=1 Tax=Phenylobacterium sp. TaxID=1871053 RepID=UPI001A37075F|nr:TonB-dependent receptor [Phenylobacterium sp.]MBL8773084.1 TonB-dependent receptor [Phenylobacterium sp.]